MSEGSTGADPGFSWRGGGGKYLVRARTSRSPLRPGVHGPVKWPGSSRGLYTLMLSQPYSFKHSDTTCEKKKSNSL